MIGCLGFRGGAPCCGYLRAVWGALARMASADPQSSGGVSVADGRGGGGGAPAADAWQQAWRAIAPQWEQMRAKTKRVPDIPILRVNQIDAARLDVEMTAMLREQLGKVFSLSQVFCYVMNPS